MTPHNDLITIPTIEDVTRRQFISGALAAALLAACGDEDEDSTPGAATRTITTKYGTYDIPADPQRIVLMENRIELEVAATLGLKALAMGTLQDIGGKENDFLSTTDANKFSIENLNQLDDVEALLVCGFGDAHERLAEEALWQRVPAVAAGRVVKTDIRTNYGGFYAALGCVDLWDQVYNTLA